MEQRCKKYVEVVADFSPDGELMPLRVIWDDGEEFEITNVTSEGVR